MEELDTAKPDDMVRIIIFHSQQWRQKTFQYNLLVLPRLHFSIGDFLAIENDRIIPQQGAFTFTNIDDIESYVRQHENEEVRYLEAIDLPVSERDAVMRELSYMGITSGAMFPGLDGACEELAERNFRSQSA